MLNMYASTFYLLLKAQTKETSPPNPLHSAKQAYLVKSPKICDERSESLTFGVNLLIMHGDDNDLAAAFEATSADKLLS